MSRGFGEDIPDRYYNSPKKQLQFQRNIASGKEGCD